MKKWIFFILILSLSLAQSDSYTQFLDYMNQPGGRVLTLDFFQDQYGERYESSGAFYYMGESLYSFDALDQRITFKNGEITTINKIEKQIIYDQTIPGEVTVFDILTGKSDVIDIGESIFEKSGFKIPFTLKDWEIKGIIRTQSSNGKPISITLITGEESEIRIHITSSTIGKEPPIIDLHNFESIDLRE